MKYEPLYKTYYTRKDDYLKEYEMRVNGNDTMIFDITVSGHKAFFVPCLEVQNLMNGILRTDKKVTVIKNLLPVEAIEQFRMESLIEEIQITNSIEGVHSTRREIRDVIESLAESKRHEKRFEGLINQYILLGEDALTLRESKDVRLLYNVLVLDEVLSNNKKNAPDGVLFRKESVDVLSPTQKVIHTGIIPEEKIIQYMQNSLDILNDESIDVLIRTAVFHYLFGYIHPFYDGNGRISRFISSYYLSKDLDSLIGNRLSYTIQDNISDYYKSFKTCNDVKNKGDITPFVIMFLNLILKAEENLLIALEKRYQLFVHNLALISNLSQRDSWDDATWRLCRLLLISSLFSKSGLSKKELQKGLGLKTNATLNTKLNKLKEYDLVYEEKEGTSTYCKLKHENLESIM